MTDVLSEERRLADDIRQRFGINHRQANRAAHIAVERFDGDAELGFWWTEADALAINVKNDRAAWNDDWARSRKG